jgi:hypothetical protein
MTIEIEGPDGSIYEFPDGTSRDVIKGALQKRFEASANTPSAPPPEEAKGGWLSRHVPGGAYLEDVPWRDIAVQGARGFNQGIDNTLNLPRTAVNLGARALGYEDPLPPIPFATRLSRLNNEEPQSHAGDMARSIGEFAGAGAIPGLGLARGSASFVSAPGRYVGNYLAGSAGGGIASEVARQNDLSPGWQMAAGILGSGVGGEIPGAAIGAGKGAASLYREALGDAQSVRDASLNQTGNAIAEARTNPNALLERVIPEPNPAHGITREDIANMVIRSRRDGATPGEIRNAIENDVLERNRRNGNPGAANLTDQDIENYLHDYNARNLTPMSVYDLVKEERNIGGATPVVRLGKATSGIVPDSETAAGIEGRQLEQSERAQDIIQRTLDRSELQRRSDLVESDFRASINKPTGTLTQSEQAALDNNQRQAALDYLRQRSAGREMESAQADLTRRNTQEFDRRYTGLHSLPDVPLNDELASIIADPLAASAWKNALTLTRDRTSPSADEVAKSFGIKNKVGLGLAEEGTPGPNPGLTAESDYNLKQMGLDSAIRRAREAGEHDLADELQNKQWGEQEKWRTRSTGQYPQYNQQALSVPTRTLDYFQRELRQAAKGPDANVINSFRQRLLDVLDPENPGAANPTLVPGFRNLMEDYRNFRTGDEAFDLGQKMGAKEGPTNREAIAAFNGMTPTQQHLFRLGRVRGMLDTVRGRNEGQNSVAPFMNRGARETNRTIFGDQAGDALNDALARENITTGTRNELYRGSQTAEKTSDMGKARAGLNAAAGAVFHRPIVALNNLMKRLEYHIGDRQAGEILKQLGSTEPGDMLQTLVDLSKKARTAGERQAYVQAVADMRAQQRRGFAAPSIANALANIPH